VQFLVVAAFRATNFLACLVHEFSLFILARVRVFVKFPDDAGKRSKWSLLLVTNKQTNKIILPKYVNVMHGMHLIARSIGEGTY
jgi:hypothetical protein